MMDRRRFLHCLLAAAAATQLGGCTELGDVPPVRGPAGYLLEQLGATLPDEARLVAGSLPAADWDDGDQLVAELRERLGEVGRGGYQQAVMEDFANGDVVEVGGWQLARIEVVAAVAAARAA